jgi:hydroxylaminobenzene mutase
LLAAGALLFLLGLFSGFAIPAMTIPRMGLSAHLEGVMNGTFLLAVGLAWSRLALSARLRAVAWWTLLYGTFANWLFVSLAARFGTNAMAPIAGAGHAGTPAQEALVAAGLGSVGLTMVIGCVLLAVGFLRRPEVTQG